jgi:hypothetical protein
MSNRRGGSAARLQQGGQDGAQITRASCQQHLHAVAPWLGLCPVREHAPRVHGLTRCPALRRCRAHRMHGGQPHQGLVLHRDTTFDALHTPRHGATRVGGPQPVFHDCAAPLAERAQDGAVHDLHQAARDPVIRLVDRLPRADVVPPAVGRTAHNRAAPCSCPQSGGPVRPFDSRRGGRRGAGTMRLHRAAGDRWDRVGALHTAGLA